MKVLRLVCVVLCFFGGEGFGAGLVFILVTPHSIAASMRYRRQRDADLGARVPLFVKGPTV
ncbi:MAG: hypothetical protein NTU53_20925, partial [Planctomycetota bacterium]|nr:hypothetical protein [Planctomycetota bacterium]